MLAGSRFEAGCSRSVIADKSRVATALPRQKVQVEMAGIGAGDRSPLPVVHWRRSLTLARSSSPPRSRNGRARRSSCARSGGSRIGPTRCWSAWWPVASAAPVSPGAGQLLAQLRIVLRMCPPRRLRVLAQRRQRAGRPGERRACVAWRRDPHVRARHYSAPGPSRASRSVARC